MIIDTRFCVKALRTAKPQDTVIDISGVKIGGGNFAVIAGPCSVESQSQIITVAQGVKKSGAMLLRGGAYKPRTSPYTFQGLNKQGLEMLLKAKEFTEMPVVSEILNVSDIDYFRDIDIIQVGARNMQNFSLLKELGKLDKPVLLKRGMGNTISELLMSAEHILCGGNEKIILCERGIRTFENATKFTLDVAAIPILKQLSHLPVIADPSHSSGTAGLVQPLSFAAVAAGCDGLLIETHEMPEEALSDAEQTISLKEFDKLMAKILRLRDCVKDW